MATLINLPIGSIIAWENSALPSGWVVCDGLNGTPDLRDKFVRGAGIDGDVRAAGGAATHSHTNPNTNTLADHNHGGSYNDTVGGGGVEKATSGSGLTTASSGHSHSLGAGIGAAGGHSHTVGDTAAASSLPKYIYRVFIRRNS